MLVSHILKSKPVAGVVTIKPAATLGDAAALLSERRIGAAVVSEDGSRPGGILSERDIVRELVRLGPACLERLVSDVMTRDPVTCAQGDRAVDVLQRMTDGRFRHMPVVEGGVMIGLISIGDVVKARLEELDAERDALEGMIKGF